MTRIGGLVAALWLCVHPALAAGPYRWVDAEGKTRFSDDPSKIPPEVRARAGAFGTPSQGNLSVVPGWTDATPLPEPRWLLGAAEGPKGKVAVAGGYAYPKAGTREYGIKEYAIRIYNPSVKTWSSGKARDSFEYHFLDAKEYAHVKVGTIRLQYESPHIVGDGQGNLLWFSGAGLVRYAFDTNTWDQPQGPGQRHHGNWEGPLPSEGRDYGSVSASPDGLRIYLSGGKSRRFVEGRIDGDLILSQSLDAYLPREDRWEYLAPMLEARSDHASAVGLDGKLYVIGGCRCTRYTKMDPEGNPDKTLASVEAYDPKTNTWAPRAPMPEGRQLLKASRAPDGRIFVTGGVVDPYASASSDHVDIYDPASDSWSAGPPLRLGRHNHAQMTSSDGLIYVLGGFRASERGTPALSGNKDDYGALDSVEVLDPSRL